MKHLDIGLIHEAFSPSKEIQAPHRFSGRRHEIESGINALMNKGGFLCVFGLRGVGKSSIAYQLKLIAEGNISLPKMMNMEKIIPRKGFNYIVYYIKADSFVKNTLDLLKRILFGDDNNDSLFSLTKSGDKRLIEIKKALEADAKAGFFGIKGNEERLYKNYISDDFIQQFRQLLGTIPKDNQDKTGLLILIDEFDVVQDKQGFASIVKSCSSDFVKFGIIGIASNITELIQDHGSIGRQIDLINVPLMAQHELNHILRMAEHSIDNLITFNNNARSMVTERSEGFPYFTHLLGREAMMIAYKRRSSIIAEGDIERLSISISSGRLNTIYEDIYHQAVKGSTQREILLKAFDEEIDDEIFTDPIYNLIRALNIANPSQLMRELTTSDHGPPILTKVRDKYYRFTDPIFKVYARIRQWKFES